MYLVLSYYLYSPLPPTAPTTSPLHSTHPLPHPPTRFFSSPAPLPIPSPNSSNSRAIRFYEKRLFSKHSFLPLYYSIQGKLKDGFSYVLYLNGGRPPWSFRSSLRSSATALASLRPCALSSRLILRVNRLLWCFVAAVFVGIKKTATISFAHGYHRT